MKSRWDDYIRILHEKVVPALGCTEPISVALACAHCRALLGETPQKLRVLVSGNLYKNGMGVGIPGAGAVGLPIAAALGAVAGDSEAGLQVLQSVGPADVEAARALLAAVRIEVKDDGEPLYAEVLAESGTHRARVVVAGGHTRIVLKECDGERVFQIDDSTPSSSNAALSFPAMTLADLFDFVTRVPLEEIAFMEEAVRLNSALAEEGMSGAYGLKIGATLLEQVRKGLLADDLMTLAMRLSSAASDARMDGAMLPAMSNSGSGNQGIAATMPVVAAARFLKIDRDRMIRAVAFSHLVAIHIKSRQPILSALCALSTASMGAGAAIAWLLGGGLEEIGNSIHNMIGDVSGIVCDGGKTGCSMKMSTTVSAAVKASMLAANHIRVSRHEGIVAEDVEATIVNLGILNRCGMRETDRHVLQIMMDKER